MTAPQQATGIDEFTELVDADFPRVDLVGKAANGTRFLIAKSAADGGLTQPLIPREMVADLIAKADAQETPVTAPAPTDDVAKDAPPVETGDLVEDAPAGGTAASLPGSPDWEQLDGDTAMNAVATLGRVKACLAWLSDREAQEAVTGDDPRDGDNSWDLDDMACQLDWMIGRLAGFAVGEHMDADMADELEQVGKAAAALVAPLAVVEGLAPIAKAGRTLSAANETKIRTAVDSLTEVLNSLPQAPAAEDVTKETAVPETIEAPAPVETPMFDAIVKAARVLAPVDAFTALAGGGRTVDVTKAKGDPAMAVFDANGKLVGVIDPADLQPIAETAPPADGDAQGADDTAADTPADDADAAAAAPTDGADSRVVPGTDTVQAPVQPDDTQTPAVAKAADTATLEEIRAQVTEDVRKGVEAELAELREQVRKMGLLPDDRRSPVLNGGTGAAGTAARDGSTAVDPLADVKKAIAEETDPAKRMAMQKEAFLAVASRFAQG